MALVNNKIGKCKECNKYGSMMFVNGNQSQLYCDICKPIVKQRNVDQAIRLLLAEGITPEMYEAFMKEQK